VKKTDKIHIVAYHKGQKKVSCRDEANHVTFKIDKEGGDVSFSTIPKIIYDKFHKKEKLTGEWIELPELV
jgi:hypothetical protein